MRRVRHARDPQVGVPLRQTLYQWLNEWAAYFATVFRLARSTRAISDLERPAASIDRISFTVSRDTVISSTLPGPVRQSNRPGKPCGEGRAPGPRGAALLLKLLNFSCSRCSFSSEHSDHFLVNINRCRRCSSAIAAVLIHITLFSGAHTGKYSDGVVD